MSHRYPTRFQLKKAHTAQPLQAAASQAAARQAAASQSVASQTDRVQDELKRQQEASSAIVNYFLARAKASESYFDKVRETINLFDYLYEHPVLLTTHLRFKDVTLRKMAQLDSEMTDMLLRLPSTLEINLHDLNIRTNIARLHNLMNMIRQKYY